MLRPRLLPILLLDGNRLVKTVRFRSPMYIGDPLNAVRIFNEKEADELILLDIRASKHGRGPDIELVRSIASEAFMPIAYGGGVRELADFQALFEAGVEKIFTNTAAQRNPDLVAMAAAEFGRQSVGVAVDVVTTRRGRAIRRHRSVRGLPTRDPIRSLKLLVARGAGEVLVSSVDREGTRQGLDLGLVRAVRQAVDVPVIAHGGVGTLEHVHEGFAAGADAVACGSLFVLREPHRAVLITYPGGDVFERRFIADGNESAPRERDSG